MATANYLHHNGINLIDGTDFASAKAEVYNEEEATANFYDEVNWLLEQNAREAKENIEDAFKAYDKWAAFNDNNKMEFIESVDYYGAYIDVLFTVNIEAGYYDGLFLSYDVKLLDSSGYEFADDRNDNLHDACDVRDFDSDYFDYYPLAVYHNSLGRKVEKVISGYVSMFNAVRDNFCTQYLVVAQCCNGETFYEKC